MVKRECRVWPPWRLIRTHIHVRWRLPGRHAEQPLLLRLWVLILQPGWPCWTLPVVQRYGGLIYTAATSCNFGQ